METGALISLALYFVVMLGIGLYAWRKSTSDVSGYMLGGRGLSPSVAALSAGASDMSGWLMMGLPGAMFVAGLPAAWIGVGLVLGAWANYLLVAPRLRVHTELAGDAITLPDYFAARFADRSQLLRVISSLVIVIFFTLYTSAGLVAGGKLFDSAFGVDYAWGLWVTAGVVLAYTLFGGFLAVSLTDFVQGCIMFVALILVPAVALSDVGGPAGAAATLNGINPDLLSLFAGATVLGVVSAMAWGLGYFGQPHVLARFMAADNLATIPRARRIAMTWMVACLAGAVATGLAGIAWFAQHPELAGPVDANPERVFIALAEHLFNPWIAGIVLSAILAAIMSTLSAQLLVCSSALTEDFYRGFVRPKAGHRELVWFGRAMVLAVALLAIWIARDPDSRVLGLVSYAWAGFGAAFGPVVLLSVFWQRMTRNGALAGMLAGAATVLLWKQTGSALYEMVPGFLAGTVAVVVFSLLDKMPSASIQARHQQVRATLHENGY